MCEKAEQWSSELERNYELLDCWKRRGDELLYSMIPRSVADRLRTEKNSLITCQVQVERVLEGCHLFRVFYKFSGFQGGSYFEYSLLDRSMVKSGRQIWCHRYMLPLSSG